MKTEDPDLRVIDPLALLVIVQDRSFDPRLDGGKVEKRVAERKTGDDLPLDHFVQHEAHERGLVGIARQQIRLLLAGDGFQQLVGNRRVDIGVADNFGDAGFGEVFVGHLADAAADEHAQPPRGVFQQDARQLLIVQRVKRPPVCERVWLNGVDNADCSKGFVADIEEERDQRQARDGHGEDVESPPDAPALVPFLQPREKIRLVGHVVFGCVALLIAVHLNHLLTGAGSTLCPLCNPLCPLCLVGLTESADNHAAQGVQHECHHE